MIVQKAFDELAALVINPLASETQVTECKRFFFSGVMWALLEFSRVCEWPDDPEGERATAYLLSLHAECEEFGRTTKGE